MIVSYVNQIFQSFGIKMTRDSKSLDDEVVFLQVDVEENIEAAVKYEVVKTPIFILIKEGAVIDKLHFPHENTNVLKENTENLYRFVMQCIVEDVDQLEERKERMSKQGGRLSKKAIELDSKKDDGKREESEQSESPDDEKEVSSSEIDSEDSKGPEEKNVAVKEDKAKKGTETSEEDKSNSEGSPAKKGGMKIKFDDKHLR